MLKESLRFYGDSIRLNFFGVSLAEKLLLFPVIRDPYYVKDTECMPPFVWLTDLKFKKEDPRHDSETVGDCCLSVFIAIIFSLCCFDISSGIQLVKSLDLMTGQTPHPIGTFTYAIAPRRNFSRRKKYVDYI